MYDFGVDEGNNAFQIGLFFEDHVAETDRIALHLLLIHNDVTLRSLPFRILCLLTHFLNHFQFHSIFLQTLQLVIQHFKFFLLSSSHITQLLVFS